MICGLHRGAASASAAAAAAASSASAAASAAASATGETPAHHKILVRNREFLVLLKPLGRHVRTRAACACLSYTRTSVSDSVHTSVSDSVHGLSTGTPEAAAAAASASAAASSAASVRSPRYSSRNLQC